MKKKILGLAVGLLMMGLPVSTVIAQAPEDIMETTTAVEEEAGSDADARKEARQERIKANKQEIAERLSENQERRLTNRCENAQQVIGRLAGNVETVVANRQAVYTGVAERLKRLSEKVSAAGADTTELDSAVVDLEEMNTDFGSLAQEYVLALTDMSAMECTDDPQGFQSTLQVARKDKPELFKSSQLMRTYINETIKPILQTIRASLTDDTTEEPEETESSEIIEETTEEQ